MTSEPCVAARLRRTFSLAAPSFSWSNVFHRLLRTSRAGATLQSVFRGLSVDISSLASLPIGACPRRAEHGLQILLRRRHSFALRLGPMLEHFHLLPQPLPGYALRLRQLRQRVLVSHDGERNPRLLPTHTESWPPGL